jgi:hypothetical protein
MGEGVGIRNGDARHAEHVGCFLRHARGVGTPVGCVAALEAGRGR